MNFDKHLAPLFEPQDTLLAVGFNNLGDSILIVLIDDETLRVVEVAADGFFVVDRLEVTHLL